MPALVDASAAPRLVPPVPTNWPLEADPAFRFHLENILEGRTPVTLHFQPIVDLARGVATGYETLARFPSDMASRPDLCFAAAARLGKSLALEEIVVRSALLSRAALPPDSFLTLNMSPAFLASENWQRVLAAHTDLAGTVVEITEEESIHNYELVRVKLAQIRALGGSVAVDDAGSGYASLQHVVEMKPSFIKLDRMFITNCHADRAKSALIEMMGRAANRLDAWIIAEGIESELELAELIHLGVPLGQGYFLGRPDPAMTSLPPHKSAAIVAHHQQKTATHHIARHIEACPFGSTPEAVRQLFASPSIAAAVVTDKWNRPIQFFDRHPIVGLRETLDLMKVQALSDPAEVLHRALTRPAATRFDPCIVINDQGEFQGILRIDRLMRGLLAAAAPAA